MYPGQTLDVQLNFRGGNVAMDNQFLLKNIKAHHNEEKMKLQIDLFGKEDTAQAGNLPTEETHFVAVMKNKDLIIKKYENTNNANRLQRLGNNERMVIEEDVTEEKQYNKGIWDEIQIHHKEKEGDNEEITEILKPIGWPMHIIHLQNENNKTSSYVNSNRNFLNFL